MMDYIIVILVILSVILNIVIIIRSFADKKADVLKLQDVRDECDDIRKDIEDHVSREMSALRSEQGQKNSELKQELLTSQASFRQDIMTSQAAFKQDIMSSQSVLKQDVMNSQGALKQELTASSAALKEDLTASSANLKDELVTAQDRLGAKLTESQKSSQESMNELIKLKLDTLDSVMKKQTEDMERSLSEIKEGTAKEVKDLKEETNESIKTLRESTERNLTEIRNNNDKKIAELNENNEKRLKELGDKTDKRLEEIKGVVEEKLTDTLNKRINESFKNVSDQLEQVYKGLGEMKSLAGDVGGLKQVLSGVKTRGILGEYQLGAILSEILSPEQYETDVATIPGSSNRVEFAIKLPGNDGSYVYLPIDSKFPGDSYRQLQDAYDSADRNAIESAKKALINVMKLEAKDIKEKYVAVPYTTNFGIMFLPFEGLYSEAVNLGMVETLQKDYQVNIVGPSTMGAMLSSLQMGFRTLAIQKRSDEVWKVLADVKTEFGKFSEQLVKMQKHLDLTSKDLDALMTTRTKALTRKLSSVQTLEQQDINVLPGILTDITDDEGAADGIPSDPAEDTE